MAANFERRLYGHAGASAHFPPNTLAAFERALADGANFIETDVHLTADDQVVMFHDETGLNQAGENRRLADCTLAELKQWVLGRTTEGMALRIATLEESLERFPTARFNVDIKVNSSHAVHRVMGIISDFDAAHRVTLASFFDEVMATVKARGYEGELSLSPSDVRRVFFAPRWFVRLFPPRGTAVQIPPKAGALRLDGKGFIDRCHALGLRVDYWTINDPAEAQRLLDLGADGIVTDDPAKILPVMPSLQR